MTSHSNIYKILNIPFSDTAPIILSKQQIKNAYHKALLKNHPDKAANIPLAKQPKETTTGSGSSLSGGDQGQGTYTIDEITNAYKILADPELRGECDRELRLQRKNQGAGDDGLDVFHTGLEVVDLEELDCSDDLPESMNGSTGEGGDNEQSHMLYWFRGCRCGDEKGFIVTEDELEAEAQHGEIVVGCRGCSLWIKVLFAVAED